MNLLITGINRSGTSYISKLLNNFSNVVILSEPPLLYTVPEPHRIMELYDYYRQRILRGEKISHGAYADGTFMEDFRTEMRKRNGDTVCRYETKDFMLGIKGAPVCWLNRVPIFKDVTENMRYVAIVRNPIDTLGSLRRFQGGANLEPINYRFYKGTKRWKDIQAIKDERNKSVRDALTWKFHSDTVIENFSIFKLVRYNYIVINPSGIKEVYEGLDPGEQLRSFVPSEIRRTREPYIDNEDYKNIERICKENAQTLGVWEG